MIELRWSPEAVEDLVRIAHHMRQHDPEAARRVVQRLYEGVGRLRDHPHSGRPGREHGTRELVYPQLPYIAVYAVRGDLVEVIAVVHGRRRWPT